MEKNKTKRVWKRLFGNFEVGDSVIFTESDGTRFYCKVVRKLSNNHYDIQATKGILKGAITTCHASELKINKKGKRNS